MTILDRIRISKENRMNAIAGAATRGDLSEVTRLSKEAAELDSLLQGAIGITERLDQLEGIAPVNHSDSPIAESSTTVRLLPIEVTQGMINQNLLTLTPHVKQKRVKPGDHFYVEAQPSGERFKTDLLHNGNKLRERGAIARFYDDASVRAGDFVELVERGHQQWTLQKAEPGKYKSKRSWSIDDLL